MFCNFVGRSDCSIYLKDTISMINTKFMNKIKILNIQQDLRADYINNLFSNDSINFSYKNANISKLNYQGSFWFCFENEKQTLEMNHRLNLKH